MRTSVYNILRSVSNLSAVSPSPITAPLGYYSYLVHCYSDCRACRCLYCTVFLLLDEPRCICIYIYVIDVQVIYTFRSVHVLQHGYMCTQEYVKTD